MKKMNIQKQVNNILELITEIIFNKKIKKKQKFNKLVKIIHLFNKIYLIILNLKILL